MEHCIFSIILLLIVSKLYSSLSPPLLKYSDRKTLLLSSTHYQRTHYNINTNKYWKPRTSNKYAKSTRKIYISSKYLNINEFFKQKFTMPIFTVLNNAIISSKY